eukprot:6120-Heterococcus_DN1.PRE.1
MVAVAVATARSSSLLCLVVVLRKLGCNKVRRANTYGVLPCVPMAAATLPQYTIVATSCAPITSSVLWQHVSETKACACFLDHTLGSAAVYLGVCK